MAKMEACSKKKKRKEKKRKRRVSISKFQNGRPQQPYCMSVSGPVVCVVPLDFRVSNWLLSSLDFAVNVFSPLAALKICMFVSFLMSVSGRENYWSGQRVLRRCLVMSHRCDHYRWFKGITEWFKGITVGSKALPVIPRIKKKNGLANFCLMSQRHCPLKNDLLCLKNGKWEKKIG